MKKIITAAALAAAAVGMATADISFGSWGRGLWIAAANSGHFELNSDGTKSWTNDVVTDVHQSWSGNAPRTALGVSGSSDNAGFVLDIHSNGTGFGQGDNALIWVKPIDMIKLSVGKHDQNVLSSDAAFGLWNWDRLGAVGKAGEQFIFADYLDGTGVDAVITPNENLTIGVGVPLSLDGSHESYNVIKDDGTLDSSYTTGSLQDAWLNSALVAAYKIENVGTVKAGLKLHTGVEAASAKDVLLWLKTPFDKDTNNDDVADDYTDDTLAGAPKGATYTRDKDNKDVKTWAQIAAAFELTSVENLYAALGARINTLNTMGHEVNVYARYKAMDQLAVHAIVGTKLSAYDAKKSADDKAYKTGFGILAGVGADYDLGEGLGVFADVRYANGIYMNSTSADHSDNLVLGLGIEKGWSNGKLGIAFEGSTNGNGRYTYKKNDDGVVDQFAWEIPVKFEYWF